MTKIGKIILIVGISVIAVVTATCAILFSGRSPSKKVYIADMGDSYYSLTIEGDRWISESAERNGAQDIVNFEKGKFVKDGDYALFTSESRGYYYTLFGKKSMYNEESLINSGAQKYVFFGRDFVIGEFSGVSVLTLPGVSYAATDVLAIMGQNRLIVNYNCDVFVSQNTGDIKDNIVFSIKKVMGNGEKKQLIVDTNKISSVKVNGEEFSNTLEKGRYIATVTYDTNKTFKAKVFIGPEAEDPSVAGLYFENLDKDLTYAIPIGTTAAQFLDGKNATIRTSPEAIGVAMTPQMINNFDTTKEFFGYFNVVYQGQSCSFNYSVYDEDNIGTYDVEVTSLNPYIPLDGDDIEFELYVWDYKQDYLIISSGDEDISISGFTNTQTGLQEISVSCSGITKNILVYVYDEENNPPINFDVVPDVSINSSNQIQGALTFTMQLADGTISAPIVLNKNMLRNCDWSKRLDGEYMLDYKTALYTYTTVVTVDFVD